MRTISMMLVAVLALAGCGGGGGGGSSDPDPSDMLMGNFRFQYSVSDSTYTSRYTFNTKSDSLTGEGTPFYHGYDADYPANLAVASWSSSSSRYLALAATALSNSYRVFSYVIENDGRLTGCFYLQINGVMGSCYELNSMESRRYDHGSWRQAALIAPDAATVYDLFVSEASMLRTGEAVDGELTAAIAGLKAELMRGKE